MDFDYIKHYKNINGKIVEIPPIDEICEVLKDKFADQVKANNKLRKENDNLKSGIWAKEEMSKIKAQYNDMKERYFDGFPISKEEKESIRHWIDEHEYEKHGGKLYGGAIGGAYTYKFTPTSIGIVGEVECNCGEKFCFRELD